MRRGPPLPPPSSVSPLPPSVLATFHSRDSEWNQQVSALKALTSAAQSPSVLTATSPAREAFLLQLRELSLPLSHCVHDLRSTLVKEVCLCIVELSHVLGAHFVEAVGVDVIPALLKRSAATKFVIRESALNAARAMFEQGVYGVSFDTARLLSRSVLDRKLPNSMRSAAAQFFGMILVEDCLSGLQAIRDAIQEAIIHGSEDPDEQVRAISRENWRRLETLDPDFAHEILNRLPPHVAALAQREKNGSPRSDKSSPRSPGRALSPRSPGRTFGRELASHRQPLTAKRTYPQRVPNGATRVEGASTSPTGGGRSPVKAYSATSGSVAAFKGGARHRTGAARVPRPMGRVSENQVGTGKGRRTLPPRPGMHASDADGKVQAGVPMTRKSSRPIPRPPRPARRSVAPNTTINFQSSWSPPTAARRNGRQSVPVGVTMPPIAEEDSAVPIPMARLNSPPSRIVVELGRQSSPLIATTNSSDEQSSPLRGSPLKLVKKRSPVATKSPGPTSLSVEPKSLDQSSPVPISPTPPVQKKSPSIYDFVMGIVSGITRSPNGDVEMKDDDGQDQSLPGNQMNVMRAQHDALSPRATTDYVPVSEKHSDDHKAHNASTRPPHTPEDRLRKGRLSFILDKTVSPNDKIRITPQVEKVNLETEPPAIATSEATHQRQDLLMPVEPPAPPDVSQINMIVPKSQEPVEKAGGPSHDDIELLMSIGSMAEKEAKAILSADLVADKEVGLEEPLRSAGIISNDAIGKLNAVPEKFANEHAKNGEDQASTRDTGLNETVHVDDANDGKENLCPSDNDTLDDVKGAISATGGAGVEKPLPKKTTAGAGIVASKVVDRAMMPRQASTFRGRGARRSVMPGTTIRLNSTALNSDGRAKEQGQVALRKPAPEWDVVVRSPDGKPKKAAQMARLKARGARRSVMPGTTIRLNEARGSSTDTGPGVKPGRPPKVGPKVTTTSIKETSRPPYITASTIVRRGRPKGSGARRSMMPGTKIQPQCSTTEDNVARNGEGSSDHEISDGSGPTTKEVVAGPQAEPGKKKKVMSPALQGVIDWLKRAKRIKRGGWQERCQALKGFAEACKQLQGERIGPRLGEHCVSMLGDYMHETHHKVVSGALDSLFFLFLCSEGSSQNLQKALEKRDDVLRRTLGLLIGGKENVRLAAARAMQSFEVQFPPEVMVCLIMRALGHATCSDSRQRSGSVADGRVAEMGCGQLAKAFERAATSGEGFIWKTGLLEAVLTGLDGMTKDRRVAVRRAGDKVVEKVRLTLPDRAFEMACDKYGVEFGEADQ